MTPRAAWTALFLLAVVGGCADPELVKVSDEAKPNRPGAATIPPDQKKFRPIGGIYPPDGGAEEGAARWWFVTLTGPSELVARHEAEVRKLIESVRTTSGEEPITWTLPPGWKEEKGGGFGRYATFKSPDGKASVTVSQA